MFIVVALPGTCNMGNMNEDQTGRPLLYVWPSISPDECYVSGLVNCLRILLTRLVSDLSAAACELVMLVEFELA